MRLSSLKLAAAAAGVALAATACIGSDEASTDAGTAPSASTVVGVAATTTKAADLRAGLTYLLGEHIQLVGLATHTALADEGDPDAPAVKAAVKTLDDNSVELSKAVGVAYLKAEEPFLVSWRQHIDFYLDYTLGKATADDVKVAQARKDLAGFRTSFGRLINSFVPELPAKAVADEVIPHFASLLLVIDAQVAGDPEQFALLQKAAGHVPASAAFLAGGIATNLELGRTDTPAADLRSGLTALLTQHVYTVGIAVSTAVAKGGNLKDPMVTSAVAAIDANSVALSKAVGSGYPKTEAPFLVSWRQHIGYFVDYALGRKAKDRAKVAMAKTDLNGYRVSFGQLINSVVPELSADAVADELIPHVDSLVKAIDAAVAGDPSAFGKLKTAARHMPASAGVLSGGIAQNLKLS